MLEATTIGIHSCNLGEVMLAMSVEFTTFLEEMLSPVRKKGKLGIGLRFPKIEEYHEGVM